MATARALSNSARSKKSSDGGIERLSPEGLTNEAAIDQVGQAQRGSHSNPTTSPQPPTLVAIPRRGEQPCGLAGEGKGQIVAEKEESESEDSESGGASPLSPEAELLAAGVDLESLHLSEDGVAPLELTTQFLACVMSEEYQAARMLCEKILECEPSNATAKEFLPVILERLRLDVELPSESSSSDSDESSEESNSSDDEEEEEETRCIHTHCT